MKKITTLSIAVALVFVTGSSFAQFSQVWNAQYQHTTTAGFSNEGRRIVEDASGNIFVMLDVTSDIDPTGLHGTGTWNYLVLNKYSTNGVLLNSININTQKHIYSGFNNLGAFGLEADASGNIYAGYITWNSISNYDVALAKYNNSLTRLWANTYGTAGNDVGIDMDLHASSGTLYAVVKSVNGNMTDYSVIESVPTSAPSLLVYTYPNSAAVINSIVVDNAGVRAYVGGYSTKGGFKNAYVGSVNLNLNTIAWGSVYTPPSFSGDDVINKVTIGIDGNIYSVGSSYQGGTQAKQVLALRNIVGNPRFDYVVLLGNPGKDENGLFIDAAESGWVYLGAVSGSEEILLYRFPSNGIFVTAGKATFAPVPASAYNSINGVSLTAMKVSTGKNIYITGGVAATDNAGTFTSSYFYKASVVFGNALIKVGGLSVEGAFDHNLEGVDLSLDYGKADVYWLRSYWDDAHTMERIELIDVNVPAPLREGQVGSTSELSAVSLTPNPAKDKVMIHADENLTSVEVTDLTGNRVLYTPLQSRQSSIDVSSLATGIYFCKIQTEAGVQIKRLVIN